MLNELNRFYTKLTQAEDSDDYIFDFKELLLSSDETEILEFHFHILMDRKNEYLYRDIFFFFLTELIKNQFLSFYTRNI